MGAGESQVELPKGTDSIQERTAWIRNREITDTALRGYLRRLDREVPENGVNLEEHIAKTLSEEEFTHFWREFRFGGRQSLNFYVITGISEVFEDVESEVRGEFPTAEEVEGQRGEPFLTGTEKFNDRLYLKLGEYVSRKTVDPETGIPQRRLDPDGCVAVINKNTDLVHVRTAEVPLAKKVCSTIASAMTIDTDSTDIFYKPNFDNSFINEFSKQIEKYINMSLRIQGGSERTAGSVKFSSRKDESGEYMDLREDEGVQKELEEGDGNISKGYIQLTEGDYALYLNRTQSKVWFKSFEPESRINRIEEIINDVLRESGGYPQQKLQGFDVVPE